MLYIPITEETLDKLIQPDVDAKSIIANLCLEELAAFLLVQQLSNYPKVIVYFLPNSAKIANTCSFISL
jgi:hypothetical protein